VHQFSKSACLECRKCGEIYHIADLAFPNKDEAFETENDAREFLEKVIRGF
jgi:DNA-directed RNA polymerase alpha subunit